MVRRRVPYCDTYSTCVGVVWIELAVSRSCGGILVVGLCLGLLVPEPEASHEVS